DWSKDISPKDAFMQVKTPFDAHLSVLTEKEEQIKELLENAFTFLEDAMLKGQEMVVFVTGLTLSQEAAMYLMDNQVPKYEKYRDTLMIGTRKAEILAKLEQDDIRNP
ncbi:MAG: ATPase, partial [Lachnospiraceae bacterium]|nr:ATPase [Lachnospiraceae bacterium]